MNCQHCDFELSGSICSKCGVYNEISDHETKPIENHKDDGPSFLEKAANFSKSLVSHASTGFANVSDPIEKERLRVCLDCEKYNTEKQSCNECGCYMPAKVKWLSSQCPLKKWPQHDISSIPKRCEECDKKKT